jgi:hypothetical protein
LNLYAYVGGNPVNAVDPTGQLLFLVGLGGLLEGGGAAAVLTGLGEFLGGIGIGYAASNAISGGGEASGASDGSAATDGAKICPPDKPCPPCSPYPVGTIGYQGPEVHNDNRGVDVGISHYHLFVVEQYPRNHGEPCKCIWKEKTKKLVGYHHSYEQPSVQFTVNLNGSGRPPNYPH